MLNTEIEKGTNLKEKQINLRLCGNTCPVAAVVLSCDYRSTE